VCPAKVGYGGRGKTLPGATAISHKMGRVALATRPKGVALEALRGTMAPRAVAPESGRPVVETCALGRTTVSPGIVVETVETCASGQTTVSPSMVVETRGASNVQTVCPHQGDKLLWRAQKRDA